jgi:hypothetical protein
MASRVFKLINIINEFTDKDNRVGLKCLTDTGYNVVFWGLKDADTHNIDIIKKLIFPNNIHCDPCRDAPEYAKNEFNVYYWIDQNAIIKII